MSQSADATSAPPPPPLNVAATFEDPSEKLLTDVEVYLRYGLNDKAIQALQVALKLRPDMPTARQRLAEIFLANNDTKAAANFESWIFNHFFPLRNPTCRTCNCINLAKSITFSHSPILKA
jgi:hypothetical protein